MVDSLIVEQALDVIKRLDVALEQGQYDRQTGKDIQIAQSQIHDLLGWIKLIEIERDDTLSVIMFD